MNEILEKWLKQCYDIHGVKIPEKYSGYILCAMKEWAQKYYELKSGSKL